ncbi:MAG: dTMP kinase [Actinomycetota bacterium]|nr:dTMP kinase [Actinomycetota bacterium]
MAGDQRSGAPVGSPRATGVAASGGVRELLAERNYRSYFLASLVSSLGDWTGLVALQALISTLYSANPRFALFGLGGVMMARLLPSLLMGPVAGVLADRYDRKRLMVGMDLVRGALFTLLAFSRSLTTLFVLTFAIECLSLLFMAAKDASLPLLVQRRQLTRANQLNLLLAYGTLPLGAVIATAITTVLVAFGLTPQMATVAALLVNAGSFFLGAALIARVHLPARERAAGAGADSPGVIEELREGARFIRDLPLVRSLIIGVVGVAFGAGVVVSIGPEFVRESLGRPATDWPRMMTSVGVGLVAGILAVPLVTKRISQERLFPLCLAATGVIAAIISTVPTFFLALVFAFVLGVAAGLGFVIGYELLQRNTTDDIRGKTFAAFYTGTRVALFSALGIAPFVAGAASGALFINGRFLRLSGIRMTIFAGGMVALYSALVALRGMYRALRVERPTPMHIPGIPPAGHPRAGLFITFEGVEGAGKSTQVKALVSTLRSEGHDVVVTREPGGPPVAERLREVLLDPNSQGMHPRTEVLLYAAARAEHVERVVAPALAEGKTVVCDRFIDSSLAYQGYAREVGGADVLEINRWAVANLLPDVVVLLDLAADEGMRRIRERAERHQHSGRPRGPRPLRLGGADPGEADWREQTAPDRVEREGLAFHRRVADGYRRLAERDAERFVVIDAAANSQTVASEVRSALRPWLPPSPARPAQPPEAAKPTEPPQTRPEAG